MARLTYQPIVWKHFQRRNLNVLPSETAIIPTHVSIDCAMKSGASLHNRIWSHEFERANVIGFLLSHGKSSNGRYQITCPQNEIFIHAMIASTIPAVEKSILNFKNRCLILTLFAWPWKTIEISSPKAICAAQSLTAVKNISINGSLVVKHSVVN